VAIGVVILMGKITVGCGVVVLMVGAAVTLAPAVGELRTTVVDMMACCNWATSKVPRPVMRS